MTPHTWKTGSPVDCAQVGVHAFTTCEVCEVCGVMRVDGDKYTSMRFETQVRDLQDTLIHALDAQPRNPRYKWVDHWVHFSMDCQAAQAEVLYYILGHLQALMVVDDIRYFSGGVITAAILAQPRTASFANIVRAYQLLEVHGRMVSDLKLVLSGQEHASSSGPPLEVEL
jgi:hypothetical protein